MGRQVDAISLLDLQAAPEHRVVLQPNAGGSSCGLTLEYRAPAAAGLGPAAERRAGASLVVQLANPRLLLLARFAADVLHGVEIIRRGLGRSGLDVGPGPDPAPEPSLPAAPAAAAVQPLQLLVHLTTAAVLLPVISGCVLAALRTHSWAPHSTRAKRTC